MGNIEYIKLGLTIITSLASVLGFYHKFIMSQIDKKVDQKIYDSEVSHMKQQTKYNYINLENRIVLVLDDVKVIKEYLLNNKR
ncbi:MAG: hypothetical protein ACRDCE_15580 [Cetobacterium sp.]|uniref:hypothetical protein n=1 Tax=Cetobacterium sp. TaxID=2071632 RepID=UPI003EE5C27F